MESILVVFIGGMVTLAGVFASNSRSKDLTCENVNAKPRGQKRKLREREFTFEFEFLSRNCPREYSKAQVMGLRHSAALKNGRTLHTQAQTSDFLDY